MVDYGGCRYFFLSPRDPFGTVGGRRREIDSQFDVLRRALRIRYTKILSRVSFFRDSSCPFSLGGLGRWSIDGKFKKKKRRDSPLPSPSPLSPPPHPVRGGRERAGKKTRRSRETMLEYERQLPRRATRHFGTMSPRVLVSWATSLAPGNRATVSLPSQSPLRLSVSSPNLSLS